MKCLLFQICFSLLLLSFLSAGQKTKNQVERESAIYPYVLFPRVFDGIVTSLLETPLQIRAYFYLNLASYNAWSNYHPTAVDCFGRSKYKRPISEHTTENKNVAVMFALWRIYQKTPASFGGNSNFMEYQKIIRERGYDPNDMSMDTTFPVGIGNKLGLDTAYLLDNDGWNSNGDLNISIANYQLPFQDYTNYVPKNNPWMIEYPFKWQPLLETDGKGFFYRQEHVVPQAGSAIAFGLTPDEIMKKVAKYPFKSNDKSIHKFTENDRRKFRSYAKKVFEYSENLTERQMILAELMDNKVKAFVSSKYNPSGILSFAAIIRFATLPFNFDWNYDDDVIFGMAANLAAFDSLVQVWKEKVRIDAIRPTDQTMGLLFGNNEKVKVWGGPNSNKPVYIYARNWQPYIRTMPHSEFPSGSSCICEASIQQALLASKGRDDISFKATIPKGSSKFYPGKIPTKDFEIQFNSLKQLNNLCGKSRLWGGVHFSPSIQAGRKLCGGIGKTSQDLIDDWVSGTPNNKFLAWLPNKLRGYWD